MSSGLLNKLRNEIKERQYLLKIPVLRSFLNDSNHLYLKKLFFQAPTLIDQSIFLSETNKSEIPIDSESLFFTFCALFLLSATNFQTVGSVKMSVFFKVY